MPLWSSYIWYPGGKTRAINILKEFIPAGTREICSPFCGGASFEFYCAQHMGIHVYASDIYEPLINFWQELKYNRDDVVDIVRNQFFPPNKEQFQYLRDYIVPNPQSSHPIYRAAAYAAVNLSSFSGLGTGFSGKYFRPSLIDRMGNSDLTNIDFDWSDYETAIERHRQRNTLFFLDPPYALEEKNNNLYGYFGNTHKGFDHEKLHQILTTKAKRWILCYNDTPYIRNLYRNHSIYPVQWTYTMKNTKTLKYNKPASELVITSGI